MLPHLAQAPGPLHLLPTPPLDAPFHRSSVSQHFVVFYAPPSPAAQINTLFPSAKSEEGIKGGVVLLRMQPPPGTTLDTAPPLRLAACYCDRCCMGGWGCTWAWTPGGVAGGDYLPLSSGWHDRIDAGSSQGGALVPQSHQGPTTHSGCSLTPPTHPCPCSMGVQVGAEV